MDHKTSRNKYLYALALCALVVTVADGQGFQTVIKSRKHVQAPLAQPRLSTYIGTIYSMTDSQAVAGPSGTLDINGTYTLNSGDLVVVTCGYKGSVTITNSEAGGQTWNGLTEQENSTNNCYTMFWCQYNGTWSADPVFTVTTGTEAFIAAAHIFRPADGSSHVWGVDVAQAAGTFTAPGSPYDVTITGITTVMDTTVVLAVWQTSDDNTWNCVTSGWNYTTAKSGLQNIQGNDLSQFVMYSLYYPKGTTSSPVGREVLKGGDAGVKAIIAFK